jgi:hypothetical protein
LRQRAQELGYVLGDDDLAAAEKFTDEMTNMQATLGGVGKLIGAELMPVMSKFFNRFTSFVVENRDKISGWAQTIAEKTEAALPTIIGAAKGMGEMMMAVGRLTSKLANLVGGFDNLAMIMVGIKFAPLVVSAVKLVGALGSLGTALPIVATGIKAIGVALAANPIGLIVTAIAGAAFLVYKYWEPISEFFSDLWSGITSAASAAFDWIGEKLSWVGKAAGKVASFFGIGDDDAGSASAGGGSTTNPGPPPMAQAEQRAAAMSGGTTNTRNMRGGDTFQISIVQQPGEDAEGLAQRVARIIEQRRNEEGSGALYDQPAGAY